MIEPIRVVDMANVQSDFVKSSGVDMQVDDFLAFLENRPGRERWELVGGMPIMMTPPLIAHQRIASNAERLINTALEMRGLDRRADREIGLQIEAIPGFRPEPEVSVIDADYDEERYAARFYGVVEVLSSTDLARNPRTGRAAIDDKVAFYRSHPTADFILVLRQDAMSAELHARIRGDWNISRLDKTDEAVNLAGIGIISRLEDLYKGVKLSLP